MSANDSLSVGPEVEVTLHFSLKLLSGEVVDSTFDKAPASFCYGDGSLPKGFEQAITGFVQGQHEILTIKPEQAFGAANPNNVQTFPRDQFKDLDLQEGLVMSFADASQAELPGVIKTFDDQEVTVDFNHPLAGLDLLFEVQILKIQALTP